MKNLPNWFYLAGSICFAFGTIIVMLRTSTTADTNEHRECEKCGAALELFGNGGLQMDGCLVWDCPKCREREAGHVDAAMEQSK